jgi:hypothetical protein
MDHPPLSGAEHGEASHLWIGIAERKVERRGILVTGGIERQEHKFPKRCIGVVAKRPPQGRDGFRHRLDRAIQPEQ